MIDAMIEELVVNLPWYSNLLDERQMLLRSESSRERARGGSGDNIAELSIADSPKVYRVLGNPHDKRNGMKFDLGVLPC